MNDWNIGYGEWRDSEPFGHKIHNYIMKYPEWSIYIRKDHKFKCEEHFDLATDTALSFGNIDCWCWGLGVAVSAMIVPCRVSRGRSAEIGSLDGEVRDMPGYLDFNQDIMHFPRAVLPQVNDVVLQCEWNVLPQKAASFLPRPRPIRIHSIYIIRLINTHFQREISHFSCGVETLNVQYDYYDSLILDKLSHLPVMNVEDSWNRIDYWKT